MSRKCLLRYRADGEHCVLTPRHFNALDERATRATPKASEWLVTC